MKRRKAIQIKAGILLVVFSLNTVIGFACSIGLNKLFTASNHHDAMSTKAVVHVHADGKKHIHYEKEEVNTVMHVHADGKKHIHHKKATKQPDSKPQKQDDIAAANQSQEDQNKCCTTKAIEFQQMDKYIPESLKIDPVFFATSVINYFIVDVLYTSYINTDIKYFVRSYHPPIPNIRIAIQSFQI